MICCRSYQDIPDDPRDAYYCDEEEQEEIEGPDEDCNGMDCVDRWKQQRGIEF